MMFKHRYKEFRIVEANILSIDELNYYTAEFEAQLEKVGYNKWVLVIPLR